MKASTLYRIAAVLLVLFAIGHTFSFSQIDPAWRVDGVVDSMRSVHFDVQGFNRSYWDFFTAAGASVGVFYLFAAVLAWQLSRLSGEMLAPMRFTVWSFAIAFAAIAAVSLNFLFIIPIAFSVLITLCLAAAAWVSAKPAAT
ncbi:MAG: hypothetical protein ABIZ70_01250 [Gemmatimonadales bacterium]